MFEKTWDISMPRIQRYGIILGVAGTVAALITRGVQDAGGFAVGAAIAYMTISSWSRLAASLNPESKTKPSIGGSAAFLVFRYALIGAVIYGIVKVLGVTPVAMLLGLLVSFGAVVIEIVQASRK